MDTGDLITVDPEILGGVPVFKGTRVPIKTLFEYLENDYSLEEFLECFPSVTRDLARQVLECSYMSSRTGDGIFNTRHLSSRIGGPTLVDFAGAR
jgi:uncharacterized protein (DUF433 family)